MCVLSLFLAVFSLQTAMAADPNWQTKQKKAFDQMGLKPGDVIDKANWQKVQNYLPEPVVGYVKQGEYVLKIGEFKYDFSNDEAWDKAGLANKGKYALGKRKEIIEKATGKFPMFIYGNPFPDLERNDPDFAMKFMHNKSVENGRPGTTRQSCNTLFIGEKKGVERVLYTNVYYAWSWAHPNGEQPNPNQMKFVEIDQLLEPYDLAGTVVLAQRFLDGTPDRGGTYVPALRRVRKTSGTNRSDPFFGSDFVTDDGAGWWGQNESMTWKIIGEKVVLCPVTDWMAEHPDVMAKDPTGAWRGRKDIPPLKFGCDDPNWKGAKWGIPFVVWVPRDVYIIEATPIDPYYNYGKMVFYIDKEARSPWFKIIANKAGEHWKTLLVGPYAQTWDNRKTVASTGFYMIIDDKRRHASACPARGSWGKYDLFQTMNDPTVKMTDYTYEKIATYSK
jgi:hypothetical protein